MAAQIAGITNRITDTDPGRSLFKRRNPNQASLTSSFVVAGGPSLPVAAGIASGTMLMSLRNGPSATTRVSISRLYLQIATSATGSSGATPGQLLWQKFSGATPTLGTSRTPAKKDFSGSNTQVTDVRDNSSSLTFAGTLGSPEIFLTLPNSTIGAVTKYETQLDPDEEIVLAVGEGIALTMNVAGPAALTWTYTYTIHYSEIT